MCVCVLYAEREKIVMFDKWLTVMLQSTCVCVCADHIPVSWLDGAPLIDPLSENSCCLCRMTIFFLQRPKGLSGEDRDTNTDRYHWDSLISMDTFLLFLHHLYTFPINHYSFQLDRLRSHMVIYLHRYDIQWPVQGDYVMDGWMISSIQEWSLNMNFNCSYDD